MAHRNNRQTDPPSHTPAHGAASRRRSSHPAASRQQSQCFRSSESSLQTRAPLYSSADGHRRQPPRAPSRLSTLSDPQRSQKPYRLPQQPSPPACSCAHARFYWRTSRKRAHFLPETMPRSSNSARRKTQLFSSIKSLFLVVQSRCKAVLKGFNGSRPHTHAPSRLRVSLSYGRTSSSTAARQTRANQTHSASNH